VLKWIKHNQELISIYRKQERTQVKGAISKRANCERYISNMRHYLKHGDWADNFYGEDQQHKIYWRTQ
jgi:hypothetical protein